MLETPWKRHAIQLYALALLDLASTYIALHATSSSVEAVEANPIMGHLGYWGTVAAKLTVFTAVVLYLPRLTPGWEKATARFGIIATSLIVLSNVVQLGIFLDPLYAAVGLPLLAWAVLGPRALSRARTDASLGQAAPEAD